MAKKTWIKIKRGILEPKHIDMLGQAWYLFFYILDQTDWETGKITDWKDEYAATDLCKPIGLIRQHRKHLESMKYITCEKKQHSQTIIVHNWTNPRRYDGLLQNEMPGFPELGNSQSQEKSLLSNDQSEGQSEGQTILEHAEISHSSYSHISHITRDKNLNNNDLLSQFLEIVKPDYVPDNLDERRRWLTCLQKFQDSGATPDILRRACEQSQREVTSPESLIPAVSAILREEVCA